MLKKMFLKLDGVPGDSKSPRHFGEIEISGFAWGSNRPQTYTSVGGPRKNQFNDLTVDKRIDKASQMLLVASLTGKNLGEGVLTIEDISEAGCLLRSMSVKLKSILIGFVSQQYSLAATSVVEMVAINFESVEVTPS